MADYQDDAATKLRLRYPGVEQDYTPLLNRYKADQGITTWEGWIAHIAASSASANMNDDQAAFWVAFVP